MSSDRSTSVARKLSIDSETETIFIGASSGGWRLQAIGESDSFFGWPILFDAIDFLESRPPKYTFRAFPDYSLGIGQSNECALIIGVLRDAILFGYEGEDGCWSGVMSEETAREILDEAKRLAGDYGISR